MLLGPRQAFSNVALALAWVYQTMMDSSMTWRMNDSLALAGGTFAVWRQVFLTYEFCCETHGLRKTNEA